MSDLVKRLRAYSGRTIHTEAADRIEALEAQLDAMIDGLELQNDAINGTPEALKATCQIVALAAKKYDPMRAQLKELEAQLAEAEEIIVCLETEMPMADRLLNQRSTINKLQAQVDALKPYLQHWQICDLQVVHEVKNPVCTCGLQQALQEKA